MATGKFEYQGFVQGRLRCEVEGVKVFGLRKARQPDAPLNITAFALNAFKFAQTRQIVRIVGPVLGSFHRDFPILARKGGKLQSLKMIAEQHLRADRCQCIGLLNDAYAGTPVIDWVVFKHMGRGLIISSR